MRHCRLEVKKPESGMVSVIVAAGMLIVMVIAAYLMQFSAGLAQQARIQNGADLAALAAASRHVQGYSDENACQAAEYIASKLPDSPSVSCIAHGENMEVILKTQGAFAWLSPEIKASALAGVSS